MTTIFDIPGTNPPNPFFTPLQALTTSTNTPDETANHIVTTVTNSPDPAHTLWELWDAFFIAVAASSSHKPLLDLLSALRLQAPTQPKNVRTGSEAANQLRSYIHTGSSLHWTDLPRFSHQWRDVHDVLEAWRDWDGVRASGAPSSSSTGAEYYLNFCVFSAALIKATNGTGAVHPIQVFYTAREVLEKEGPKAYEPKPHRMASEQVWALDVKAAAIWIRDGATALWETDQVELRKHWGAALDDKTELWAKEDGLTRQRWQLWEQRLRTFGAKGTMLDEEARAVVVEAADVVRDLLKE